MTPIYCLPFHFSRESDLDRNTTVLPRIHFALEKLWMNGLKGLSIDANNVWHLNHPCKYTSIFYPSIDRATSIPCSLHQIGLLESVLGYVIERHRPDLRISNFGCPIVSSRTTKSMYTGSKNDPWPKILPCYPQEKMYRVIAIYMQQFNNKGAQTTITTILSDGGLTFEESWHQIPMIASTLNLRTSGIQRSSGKFPPLVGSRWLARLPGGLSILIHAWTWYRGERNLNFTQQPPELLRWCLEKRKEK